MILDQDREIGHRQSGKQALVYNDISDVVDVNVNKSLKK